MGLGIHLLNDNVRIWNSRVLRKESDAKMAFILTTTGHTICTAFIPVNDFERKLFYIKMRDKFGIDLPVYETILRKRGTRPEDLSVLLCPVKVGFYYCADKYLIHFDPGFVYDTASVPTALVHGKLNKFGQHIELAALVHDLLFNQQLVPFEDANNIFEGIIKEVDGCSAFTRSLYKLGVSSHIGRALYRDNEKYVEDSWMVGYYTFVKEPV